MPKNSKGKNAEEAASSNSNVSPGEAPPTAYSTGAMSPDKQKTEEHKAIEGESVQVDIGQEQLKDYSIGTKTPVYEHACRGCYDKCLETLHRHCYKEGKAVLFKDILNKQFNNKVIKIEDYLDREIFALSQEIKDSPEVQIFILSPQSLSRITHHIILMKKLSQLREGEKSKTFGFLEVKRISYVIDTLPEHFIDAILEYEKSGQTVLNPSPKLRPESQAYIVVETEASGIKLFTSCKSQNKHIEIRPRQAQSIIGQVACALAVAELEYAFEHRNLVDENVRIVASRHNNEHFLINGRTCCVNSNGIKVLLSVDTLNRMDYREEIILHAKTYKTRLSTLNVYNTMERICNNEWESFHPETNSLWLSYIVGHLIDFLTVPNPTGEWQRKLELLSKVHKELYYCNSALHFVAQCITKLGHIHQGTGYYPHSWERREEHTKRLDIANFLRRKSLGASEFFLKTKKEDD